MARARGAHTARTYPAGNKRVQRNARSKSPSFNSTASMRRRGNSSGNSGGNSKRRRY